MELCPPSPSLPAPVSPPPPGGRLTRAIHLSGALRTLPVTRAEPQEEARLWSLPGNRLCSLSSVLQCSNRAAASSSTGSARRPGRTVDSTVLRTHAQALGPIALPPQTLIRLPWPHLHRGPSRMVFPQQPVPCVLDLLDFLFLHFQFTHQGLTKRKRVSRRVSGTLYMQSKSQAHLHRGLRLNSRGSQHWRTVWVGVSGKGGGGHPKEETLSYRVTFFLGSHVGVAVTPIKAHFLLFLLIQPHQLLGSCRHKPMQALQGPEAGLGGVL